MKIETKRNIGDYIYFMNDNLPIRSKIVGISFFNGYSETVNGTRRQGKNIIIYHTEARYEINSDEAFSTKEELKKSLFDNLD